MEVFETIIKRRSIRSYEPRDITREDITTLIEAARFAPSAGNCQPWKFIVVCDKAVKMRIKDECCNQNSLSTAPVLIIVCADIGRSENRYGARGRDFYCIQDTAAAVQNILLCAKSRGLGTCWCGAFNESVLSDILGLEQGIRPVALIPVGYPANDNAEARRRPLDEILTVIGEI